MSAKPLTDHACKGLDVSPWSASNWIDLDGSAVLVVKDSASLHHKIAMAWGLASEIETLARATGGTDVDEDLAKSLCVLIWERSETLKVLLNDLGGKTSKGA